MTLLIILAYMNEYHSRSASIKEVFDTQLFIAVNIRSDLTNADINLSFGDHFCRRSLMPFDIVPSQSLRTPGIHP
jgi:hypothetical protein